MGKERNYIVYMHICPNGKKYIGITCQDIKRRWKNNGEGYKKQIFYRAIEKYGWDNIEHIILFENLTEEEAKNKEIELIKEYNTYIPNGYNMSIGGEGTNGWKMNDVQKNKCRDRMINNNPFKGHHHSEKTKKELKELANNRYSSSKNIQDKISNSLKEYYKNHESPTKGNKWNENQKKAICKKVSQYNKNGMYIQTFNSLTEAGINYNVKSGVISNACTCHHLVKGFQWRYFNDDNNNITPYINKREKRLVCDNILYCSVNEFCQINDISVGIIIMYLKNKRPMPQKWKDRGLRYYNEEIDKDLSIYQKEGQN